MTDFPSFRPSKERPRLLFCCGAHSTEMHHSIHVADGGIDLPSALEPKHWQSQHMIPGMDKEPPQNHSIPEPSGFQYVSKHTAEVQHSLDLAALPTSALLRFAEARCRVKRQFVHRLLQRNLRNGFARERQLAALMSSAALKCPGTCFALHFTTVMMLVCTQTSSQLTSQQHWVLHATLCRDNRRRKASSWKPGHKSHSISHGYRSGYVNTRSGTVFIHSLKSR